MFPTTAVIIAVKSEVSVPCAGSTVRYSARTRVSSGLTTASASANHSSVPSEKKG